VVGPRFGIWAETEGTWHSLRHPGDPFDASWKRNSQQVLEALGVGERIADRHRVTVTKSDGSTSEIEVYLFGTLDPDGRLRRVDEVTRVVVGEADDADLARAR
jgi:hypothetical protein